MFSKEEMILHTFTYMNNVLSNTSVPLGCHMNLDFSSIVVPTLVSWGWGWLLSKLERGWRLIFMDYSHEEFTSHRFRPTEIMHFGNNISGHCYNKANTFRLFFSVVCNLNPRAQQELYDDGGLWDSLKVTRVPIDTSVWGHWKWNNKKWVLHWIKCHIAHS